MQICSALTSLLDLIFRTKESMHQIIQWHLQTPQHRFPSREGIGHCQFGLGTVCSSGDGKGRISMEGMYAEILSPFLCHKQRHKPPWTYTS